MSQKKYGRPIVVFDGYDNSTVSTKQMTQQRRSSGKVGTTVTFEEDMTRTTKKDVFLAGKARHKDHQNQCRRLGVEDERRSADSCDDGFTSSTRQPSTHSEMQLPHRDATRCDVPAASTTWNVLLHVASAKALAATNSSVLAQEDCGQ
ncbi:hypothetical protein OS493_022999 [Desmophyllum pertusum]|uniref:Uncharacterized protein n=1 Tax=Desmophyllum pertusum TaxID=174260 RepID=A0A9X0CYS8_9CNID|nr:hypothetical protein OS493_022999 [Desmophyllum pertusum]